MQDRGDGRINVNARLPEPLWRAAQKYSDESGLKLQAILEHALRMYMAAKGLPR